MSTALNFKPDYYKITRLLEPNILEVEETWFIKLKGVNDSAPPEELKKWLKEGDIVRIIPYRRNNEARIISDVWLGNTHINRQFSNYKKDNLRNPVTGLYGIFHKGPGGKNLLIWSLFKVSSRHSF